MTFTETDVREFFDQTLDAYLTFWDSEGVLHTGYFESDTDEDYQAASERTSEIVATDAGIGDSSYVLDVGCGCGNFLLGLADRFSCQDALFLVPDKRRSHAEMYRVLRPGGILAFSDFLQPRPEISDRARKHVYDRVRWNAGYSFLGYQSALARAGFEILLARNLASHLRQTYRVLGRTARERAETTSDQAVRDWMLAFAVSCGEIQTAIDDGEFGWGTFVARKPEG